MSDERVPYNKTTVTMMVALIILFLIGILVRWEYISTEVSDSFRQRFSTETPVATTDSVPSAVSGE